jgi:hypothetical protein
VLNDRHAVSQLEHPGGDDLVALLQADFYRDKIPTRLPEANGLKACTSVAEVAGEADLIFLSLHSPKAVEEVCATIADAKGRTHTIADMSTTPVKLTKALHARLAAHGITLVDAPVAGMRARAHAGTVSIMVGATAEISRPQPHPLTWARRPIAARQLRLHEGVNNMVFRRRTRSPRRHYRPAPASTQSSCSRPCRRVPPTRRCCAPAG